MSLIRSRESSSPAGAALDSASALPQEVAAVMADAAVRLGQPLILQGWDRSNTGPFILRVDRDRETWIGKIAIRPDSRQRVQTNAATLTALHSASWMPPELRDRIPRCVLEAELEDLYYTLETCLPGTVGWNPPGDGSRLEPLVAAAASFISDLHAASRAETDIDEEFWVRRMAPAVGRVGRVAARLGHGKAFARLSRYFYESLLGRTIPLVVAHGNYSIQNVLFESDGRLCGVIDWDLAEVRGLPLLDLYYLLSSAGRLEDRRSFGDVIRREDRLLRRGGAAPTPVQEYCERLGVAHDLIRPLYLLHWIQHIEQHFRYDTTATTRPAWLRKNVSSVLLSLRSLRAAPARRVGRMPDPSVQGGEPLSDLRELEIKKKQSYTREAAFYDERRYENPGQRLAQEGYNEVLLSILDLAPYHFVLDVACGTGRGAIEVARAGPNVFAADLTDAMLRRLLDKARSFGLDNVWAERANARCLPFRDDTFDRVLSLRFLHLIPWRYQRLFVDEMMRVLKPGGTLAVSLDNPVRVWGKRFLGYLLTRFRGERDPWPGREQSLFRGLNVRYQIGIQPAGLGALGRLNRAWALGYSRLSRRVPLRFLCKSTLYVCRKVAPTLPTGQAPSSSRPAAHRGLGDLG